MQKFNLSSLPNPKQSRQAHTISYLVWIFPPCHSKEASFLDVKLFSRPHISKCLRNSMWLGLDYFGRLERLYFSRKNRDSKSYFLTEFQSEKYCKNIHFLSLLNRSGSNWWWLKNRRETSTLLNHQIYWLELFMPFFPSICGVHRVRQCGQLLWCPAV